MLPGGGLCMFLILLKGAQGKTKAFNLRHCHSSSKINLRENDAVFLSGTMHAAVLVEVTCKYVIESPSAFRFVWIFIYNVDLIAYNYNLEHAVLIFKSEAKDLVRIDVNHYNHVFSNLMVTPQLISSKINWTKDLSMTIILTGSGTLNISIMFVPIFYCNDTDMLPNLFHCMETYDSFKICIPNNLACDGYINCMLNANDESKELCSMTVFTHLLIAIVSIFAILGLMTWFIFKLLPCFITQNVNQRPNVNTFMIWLQDGIRRRQVVVSSVSTPSFLSIGPPLFGFHKSGCIPTLPPTYSGISNVALYPDFFKKFFGHDKSSVATSRQIIQTNTELTDNLNVSENVPSQHLQ